MNNLNTLPGNEDIKDKIIFLKVDFNIPIKDGKVIDDTKIVKMKEIINKLLSRQILIENGELKENLTQYGGYILSDSKKDNCNLTIIATGSEVEIALDVQKKLNEKNIESKVISMPCLDYSLINLIIYNFS